MATAVVEDVMQDEEPQGFQFTDFIDQEEEFAGFDEKDDVHHDDKDSTEEELERLVFGDSAGFRTELKKARQITKVESQQGKEDEEQEETGLESARDDALFFFDTGPSNLPIQPITDAASLDEEDDFVRRDPPAWEDSDDERITISLASVPRLRKLRKTEAEDIVTGKEYIKRLRLQFERLYPRPEWSTQASQARPKKKRRTSRGSASDASSSEDEMDISDSELSTQPLAKLLRNAESLTDPITAKSGSKKRKLRPEVLDIQRTKDIQTTGFAVVTSLQIHPTIPLLLSSGGASGTLSLYQLNSQPPNPHPILTTLHIKGTPLETVSFHPSPNDPRIFLAGRRRYFHVWNLVSGTVEKITRIYGHQHEQHSMERFKISPTGTYLALLGTARKDGGVINILDATTLQWIAQARVEAHGGVADFCWWTNSKGLSIVGKSGEVAEWDLEEGNVIGRWRDEGAVGITVLALGGKDSSVFGGDRWVAIGSSSGIVNVYDRRSWGSESKDEEKESNVGIPKNPKPKRVLDQLTTPVSHLEFSPDGQVLCMASRWKKDALRLVHLPSCTVYRNWPTSNTPIGRISAAAFGEVDGDIMLVVGNEAGKIRGWEIRG